VAGESILGRAVRLLISAGIRNLVVATGYRQDDVQRALANVQCGVTFCHNADFASTQNAVSLFHCARALAGKAFLKLDGEVHFSGEILPRLHVDDATLAAAIERRDDLGDEEMKVLVEKDAIRAFGKKLDPRRAAGESIGIEKLDALTGDELFAELERAVAAGRTDLYYEDVYGDMIARGLFARAVDISDLPWIEVDTPDDLMRAREWVSRGRLDVRNV
jgi:choline kinase